MSRLHKRTGSSEKKRDSGGADSDDHPPLESVQEEQEGSEAGTEQDSAHRHIYFNIPLPNDARDEHGHPLMTFGRNKIRTAKYTPLSFIPKNLWLQFHSLANVYFLFVIILAVSPSHSL